ncbi:helix-turn-helix domain-containing protein [Natrarchaeobius sp. A-rgal3]|uniref:helix-turn-helix domain-containing protein n=1 Tax=Natrarchaeobius versutus TaxID=1679078 RepID=UPI0035104C7F
MTLIVEFELDTPILRIASDAIDRIRLEEVYETESGDSKLLFCAFGSEFDRFESALADDPTVREFTGIEEALDRQLYSVVLTEQATERLTYPVAAEYDVSVLEIVISAETVVRARVPSREALSAYRERCLEKGVGFQVRRLYREQNVEAGRYGLTDPQHEALRLALEAGYFDVPRETTLSELATDLEVSSQALSARLRRGQASVLERALRDDPT